jgi:hypothetical protein
MDRISLLTTAVATGCMYAAFRVLVAVLYPLAASYFWQFVVGPSIARRWPAAAQSADKGLLSYIPDSEDQPFVFQWGLGSVSDVSQGLRDGLLLGAFVALVPEFAALMLTLLAAIPLVRGSWLISKVQGPARTEVAFETVRQILLYVVLILAIHATGLLSST